MSSTRRKKTSSQVDLFIGADCSVQHIDCKSIVDMTTPMNTYSLHESSNIDWNSKTNICCWHCCETFDGKPVPIPYNFDVKLKKYQVYGVFCSFSCAKGYLIEHNPFDIGRKTMLLKEVAVNLFGKDISNIIAAPPRECLQRFGGKLSIDEFRTIDTQHVVETPPFLPHYHVMVSSSVNQMEGNDRWNVHGLRRNDPLPSSASQSASQPDLVMESQGQRGMYFEFIKKQDEIDRHGKGAVAAQAEADHDPASNDGDDASPMDITTSAEGGTSTEKHTNTEGAALSGRARRSSTSGGGAFASSSARDGTLTRFMKT